MSTSGIVLAGGKGLRLGRNKALETVGNQSLLERSVSSLGFLDGEIIIVVAAGQTLPTLNCPRCRAVTDIYPGRGPLGGVYTGLMASHSYYNLAVACDMPFLNQALLRYLTQVAPGYDLVVPRLDGMVEPLHAVYSLACLPPIEGMLREDRLSVRQLLASVKVRYVEAEELRRFDPEHLSFFNINTEADLVRAREIAERETHD